MGATGLQLSHKMPGITGDSEQSGAQIVQPGSAMFAKNPSNRSQAEAASSGGQAAM
jgi:hypothetical protein